MVPIAIDVLNAADPTQVDKKVVAIIDIDCAVEAGFDETDRRYLEELASLLARACDW